MRLWTGTVCWTAAVAAGNNQAGNNRTTVWCRTTPRKAAWARTVGRRVAKSNSAPAKRNFAADTRPGRTDLLPVAWMGMADGQRGIPADPTVDKAVDPMHNKADRSQDTVVDTPAVARCRSDRTVGWVDPRLNPVVVVARAHRRQASANTWRPSSKPIRSFA